MSKKPFTEEEKRLIISALEEENVLKLVAEKPLLVTLEGLGLSESFLIIKGFDPKTKQVQTKSLLVERGFLEDILKKIESHLDAPRKFLIGFRE